MNGVPHPFASGVCNKGKPSEPFAGQAREGLFIFLACLRIQNLSEKRNRPGRLPPRIRVFG